MRVQEGGCGYAAQQAAREAAMRRAAIAQGGSAPKAEAKPAPSAAEPKPEQYASVLGKSPRPEPPQSPEVKQAAALQADIAKSPNRDRALALDADLKRLSAQDPAAKERITPEIRESLLRGVAEPRTDHDRGKEGVLGRAQAKSAAETLAKMPKADYDALKSKLDAAKSDTERALILKAAGARGPELTGSDAPKREAALREVTTFGDQIRGTPREELVRKTSLVDLDGKNTSTIDPDDPQSKAGPDARADNDALTQRYGNSCAPAVAQIVRGEADPIYAKRLHDEGLSRLDDTSTSAREQQKTLTDAGAKTQSNRVESDKALTRLADINGKADEHLSGADRQMVSDYFSNKPVADTQRLDGLLERCGTTRAEVEKIRASAAGGDGMSMKTAADALASERTGVTYREASVGPKGVAEHLPALDKRLADGHDVPVTIDYGGGAAGHALAITDARDGKYLVTDPSSGRSAWVPKRELLDGSFSEKHFDLSRGKVDALYL